MSKRREDWTFDMARAGKNAPEPNGVCERIDGLIEAYALGALEREETERVERHLPDCATCAREVAAARRAVGLMPLLAPPAIPSPQVKTELFARIAQAQQEPAATAHDAAQPPPSLTPLGTDHRASRKQPSRPARSWPPPRPRSIRDLPWPGAARLVAVPLALALAVVGAWAVALQTQVADGADRIGDLEARLDTMGQFLASDNRAEVPLVAGPAAPSAAAGKVIAEPGATQAMVVVQNLAAEDGYRVMVDQGGELVPIGTIQVDGGGDGQAVVTLDRPLHEYQGVHIKPDAANDIDVADVLTTPTWPGGTPTDTDAGAVLGALERAEAVAKAAGR